MTVDSTSHQKYFDKFREPDEAARYARSLVRTPTHRREQRCIRQLFAQVPAEAKVLDLPCGAGRFLPTLLEQNYHVTQVDVSAAMVDQARTYAREQELSCDHVQFMVGDVLNTSFADGAFDAVLCNRLFHHFQEPEIRRAALRELARISRGPIVVSFFCNLGWDGLAFHIRNTLRRRKAVDRIPIGYGTFKRDIRAAGLTLERTLPTRPGISKQWYLLLRGN